MFKTLAALALPDGTAADALAELGVDAVRLREAIDQVHSEALAAVGLKSLVPAAGHRRRVPRAWTITTGRHRLWRSRRDLDRARDAFSRPTLQRAPVRFSRWTPRPRGRPRVR